MVAPNIHISTENILLYASPDEKYKDEMEGHLRLLLGQGLLVSIKTMELTRFYPLQEELSKFLEKTTSLICLVSHSFIASEFDLSQALKDIMEAHRLDKIKVIPVLIEACDLSGSRFSTDEIIRYQEQPIGHFRGLPDYHIRLGQVMTEVFSIFKQANYYEEKQERTWKKTIKENTIHSYHSFLNLYQYSKYVTPARQNQDELKDEKMWKEARSFDTIAFYVDYLTSDVPVKKYKKEAIENILKIEAAENVERNDLENTENPALLFHYKNRFREKGALNEVDQKLLNIFKEKPLDTWFDHDQVIDTQNHYLTLSIFRNCNPNEIFSYQLIANAITRLIGGIQIRKRRLRKRYEVMWIRAIAASIIALLILSIFAIEVEDFFYKAGVFLKKPIPLLGILLFLTIVTCSFFWILYNLQHDQKTCDQKTHQIRKHHVELKIAFLAHRPVEKAHIIFAFNKLEDWFRKFVTLTTLDYFLPEPDSEPDLLEKQKFIENKINLK